jgi:hypothetical protein
MFTVFSRFKHFALIFCCALLVAGMAWLLQSCSMTVTGVELTHEEKIVVYASLVAGEPVNNIQITRTLPPLDTFNVERSRLENAEGFITVDGTRYPLRLQARTAPRTLLDSINFNTANQPSLYEAVGLRAEVGKTYALQVSWNGKQATATTRVPEQPTLEAQAATVDWRPEPFRYVVNRPRTFPATGIVPSMLANVTIPVMARGGEAYRIENFIARDTMTQRSTNNTIALNTTTLQGGNAGAMVQLTSQTRYYLAGDSLFRPQLFTLSTRSTVSTMRIIAHDAALLDFVGTQSRNNATASPFGSSGQNPLWNVRGDGIGLFIGQSRPLQVIVRP